MTGIYINKEQDIRLAPFAKEHIRPILMLMNQEGWYYYDEKELERYLKLQETCFTLLHDEEVIGSIFTTRYGNQAWLGNIIVSGKTLADTSAQSPAGFLYRNRGYGGKMIRHAIQILGETGIKTFRLGSVPTAIGAYRKVGFQAESFTTAQEAYLPIDVSMDTTSPGGLLTVEEMTPGDVADDVTRIDKTFFKSKRSDLYQELYRDSLRKSCLCLKDQGTIVGYIMIRRRTSSKVEGKFTDGPDMVYRLGPSCVLPKYGLEGFKTLFKKAIQPVNDTVKQSGTTAKIYVVFPQNADKGRIYADFEALGGTYPEQVFDEHDHIFDGEPLAKNDSLWSWMESIGFQQEYFEQTMSLTPGEEPGLSPGNRAAHQTTADGEGIFASATPGDKA